MFNVLELFYCQATQCLVCSHCLRLRTAIKDCEGSCICKLRMRWCQVQGGCEAGGYHRNEVMLPIWEMIAHFIPFEGWQMPWNGPTQTDRKHNFLSEKKIKTNTFLMWNNKLLAFINCFFHVRAFNWLIYWCFRVKFSQFVRNPYKAELSSVMTSAL